MLVAWGYGGVSPHAFWGELQYPISVTRFLSGLAKAPFMALAIGVIATMEGFAVQRLGGIAGSAGDGLGGQVDLHRHPARRRLRDVLRGGAVLTEIAPRRSACAVSKSPSARAR